MKIIAFLISLITAFAVGTYVTRTSYCGAACNRQIISVDVKEFQKQIAKDDIVIIDVRTPQEYSSGHVPGSLNSNFNNNVEFNKFLDSLDKNGKYLIYCRSGNRSAQAMKIMEEKGFMEVTNLSGGVLSWQAENLPLDQ